MFCFFIILFFSPPFVFALSKVIITEIGACFSGDGEWIEVMNISDESVDLTTWKFYEQGSNHGIKSVGGDGILAPNAAVIIVDKQEDFSESFPGYSGNIFDSSWGSLKNSGELIGLRDAEGSIDPAEYFTYPHCDPGKSLERVSVSADPHQADSWQTSSGNGTLGVGIERGISSSGSEEEDASQEGPYEEESTEVILTEPEEELTSDETEEVVHEILEENHVEVMVETIETSRERYMSQSFTTKISEIQPRDIGKTSEWFEFYIDTDEGVIDISDWGIDRGDGNIKLFKDYAEGLVFSGGGQRLSGETIYVTAAGSISFNAAAGNQEVVFEDDQLIFLLEERGWFYWQESPVSFPNTGGTIRILDGEENILDEAIYGKSKSGTRKGMKWAEVWNWAEESSRWIPLLYHEEESQHYRHSRGFPNDPAPVHPEDIELLISEVSPDRDKNNGPEFIELYVQSLKTDRANLKYLEVKHNGSSLILIEHDLFVGAGDFILIKTNQDSSAVVRSSAPIEIHTSARNSISKGSGTVEVILFAETSYEATEDFLCWKEEAMNATEAKRIAKMIEAKHWSGECYGVANLIKNESIARNIEYYDRNNKGDFFSHYNGSPGRANESHNTPPVAVITLQESQFIAGPAPFLFNVTGEDSMDIDGSRDIKSYIWTIDGELFSTEKNPPSQKIITVGKHEIQLRVEDHSGSYGEDSLVMQVYAADSKKDKIVLVDKPVKIWIKDLFDSKIKKSKNKTHSQRKKVSDKFFDEFLKQVDAKVLENIIIQSRKSPPPIVPFYIRAASVPKPVTLPLPIFTQNQFIFEAQKPVSIRALTHSSTELPLIKSFEKNGTISPPESSDVQLYEEGEEFIVLQKKERLPLGIKKKVAKNLSYIFLEWREEIGTGLTQPLMRNSKHQITNKLQALITKK